MKPDVVFTTVVKAGVFLRDMGDFNAFNAWIAR